MILDCIPVESLAAQTSFIPAQNRVGCFWPVHVTVIEVMGSFGLIYKAGNKYKVQYNRVCKTNRVQTEVVNN